jgi:hypothetical protein
MKLHRVFLIALMASAFAVAGCGDSGGQSASSVCGACDLPDRAPACESRYNTCIAAEPNDQEECALLALEQCGAL